MSIFVYILVYMRYLFAGDHTGFELLEEKKKSGVNF